ETDADDDDDDTPLPRRSRAHPAASVTLRATSASLRPGACAMSGSDGGSEPRHELIQPRVLFHEFTSLLADAPRLLGRRQHALDCGPERARIGRRYVNARDAIDDGVGLPASA